MQSAALPVPPPRMAAASVDRIVVLKAARTLQLIRNGQVFRSYSIALGRDPTGPKRWEWDGRTPEGRYTVVGRNPKSHFYLALVISYPNERDAAEAVRLGVTPGGDIEIHGQPNRAGGLAKGDWTDGCIAVSNAAMRDIWSLVPDGTPIDILP